MTNQANTERGQGLQEFLNKKLGCSLVLFMMILQVSTIACKASIINVPSIAYPTIQSGIDHATDGDTVLLSPGTYTGDGNKNLYITDLELVMMSEGDPETCIIDCEEDERACLLEYGYDKTIIFEGITFRNGRRWTGGEDYGGAFRFRPRGTPLDYGLAMFIRCNFENNSGLASGGALYMGNVSLYVSHCVFTGNHSNWTSGAISCGAGITSTVIEDSVFSDNSAVRGSAVLAGNSNDYLEISRCRMYNNTSSNPDSGSITTNVLNEVVKLSHCEFFGYNRLKFWGDLEPFGYVATAEVTNCLLTGSSKSIIALGYTMEVYLRNCTIVDNDQGIYATDYSFIDATDCIIRGNGDWQMTGNVTAQYSNIEGGFSGEGNIDADPLLKPGPGGDFYLSQVAAGDPEDSPCVDAGSDLAENICFTGDTFDFCMDERTTRTDSVFDSGFVDMGYHYQIPTPTNTPMPTVTPTMTPTATLTPTPTSTPLCTTTGVTLYMPADYYRPGDISTCTATVCNAEGSTLEGYPLFVVLDVYGALFWGPGFTESVDSYLNDFPVFQPGTTAVAVIPEFLWPDTGSSAANIRFVAALTNPGISTIFGEMDVFEFGWGF